MVNTVADSPTQKAGLRGGCEKTEIHGRQIVLGGHVIEQIGKIKVRKIDDIVMYFESVKSGESVTHSICF